MNVARWRSTSFTVKVSTIKLGVLRSSIDDFFFGNNAIPAAILDFETTKAESEIVSRKRFVVYRESIRAIP